MIRFTAVMASAIAALAIGSIATAQTAQDLMAQGKTAYEAREYSAAGIVKAQEAADLYAQAAKLATDKATMNAALVAESQALYFVGAASQAKQDKIDKHLAGLEVADVVVKSYGVTDVLALTPADEATLKAMPAADVAMLGDALYFRGINLGQWGKANGVAESVGRWPELRKTMELMITIGAGASHEYGAYRTLGVGYANIARVPGMGAGADVQAAKYLGAAFKNTNIQGTVISSNGYTNLYVGMVTAGAGKVDEAKALLDAFIAADGKALGVPQVVEFAEAQKEAAAFLATL